DDAQVTFTFSEAVTSFTNADLTVQNGTHTSVTSSEGGITWTAKLTAGGAHTYTTVTITPPNPAVFGLAGNANSGATDSNNYAVDSVRPTVALSFPTRRASDLDDAQVTFTFSEAVTSFTNADLSVQNGTLTSVSASDCGITWTATL